MPLSAAKKQSFHASNRFNLHRACLVRRLTGVGIKGRKGQPVCFAIVHGNEELPRSDRRRHKCRRSNLRTPGCDSHEGVFPNAQLLSIVRIYFHIAVGGIKLAQHIRFARPGVGVPLRRCPASGHEEKRIFCIDLLRCHAWLFENETCPTIRGKELAVLEQSPFRRNLKLSTGKSREIGIAERPLDAATFIDHAIVADASDIVGHPFRNCFQGLKDSFGRSPPCKHPLTSPIVRDQLANMEIGKCPPRRASHFLDESDSALGVDQGAFLFAPARCRKVEVRSLCGLGGRIHVLHNEEIEFVDEVVKVILMDPRVG